MAQKYTLKTEVKFITDLFTSSKMVVKSNEIEENRVTKNGRWPIVGWGGRGEAVQVMNFARTFKSQQRRPRGRCMKQLTLTHKLFVSYTKCI